MPDDKPAAPSRKLQTEPPPLPEGFTLIEGHRDLAFNAQAEIVSCRTASNRPGFFAAVWRQVSIQAVKNLWHLIPARADLREMPPLPEGFRHLPDRPGLAVNADGLGITCRQYTRPMRNPAAKCYRGQWRVVNLTPGPKERGKPPRVNPQPRPEAKPPALPPLPPKSREEREAMLAGVDRLVGKWVRESGVPKDDREDAEQDAKLELWKQTENFDPNRGVQWSTYASVIVKRMVSKRSGAIKSRAEVHVEDWSTFVDGRGDFDAEERDETAGQLFDAVQRQLTAGLLDAITPRSGNPEPDPAYLARLGIQPQRRTTGPRSEPKSPKPTATLPAREVVERIVFDGLSASDLATQAGHETKTVRVNLKNAIRTLQKRGLTQHVATDAEVDAVIAPDPGTKHCKKPKPRPFTSFLADPWRPASAPEGEGQEPACTVTPAEPHAAA